MVAQANVVVAAAAVLRDGYDALPRADQGAYCKWVRGLRRGLDENQVLKNAERKLKPKAINWDNLLAFIQKVMPLVIAMITKA